MGMMAEEDNDEECYVDAEGEDLPEDEVEWRLAEKAKAKKEMREAMEEGGEAEMEELGGEARRKEVWEEEGGDDDVSCSAL